MRLPIEIKERAINLRKRGYSVKEIARECNIAQSTSSLWLRNVPLDKKAQERLEKRKLIGYYRAGNTWKRKRIEREKEELASAREVLKEIKYKKTDLKLYCALLYWCEGSKGDKDSVKFVNSDPTLIHLFLFLFRKSFSVDEKKFRAILHLHDYHDDKKQKKFWSKITGIPESQFYKTYRKPNTKKRIKEGYPGCISTAYYDCSVARELKAIYKEFAKFFN